MKIKVPVIKKKSSCYKSLHGYVFSFLLDLLALGMEILSHMVSVCLAL